MKFNLTVLLRDLPRRQAQPAIKRLLLLKTLLTVETAHLRYRRSAVTSVFVELRTKEARGILLREYMHFMVKDKHFRTLEELPRLRPIAVRPLVMNWKRKKPWWGSVPPGLRSFQQQTATGNQNSRSVWFLAGILITRIEPLSVIFRCSGEPPLIRTTSYPRETVHECSRVAHANRRYEYLLTTLRLVP